MVTSNITHLEECAVKLCIGNSKNSRDTLSSTAFPTFCQYCFLQRGNNKLPFLTSPKVVLLPKLPVRNNKGTNLSRVGRGADFFWSLK